MYHVAHIVAFYESRLTIMTLIQHTSGINAARHMLRHNDALLIKRP